MKTYTTTEIYSIILKYNLVPTVCTNEKDGKYCKGISTIQICFNGEENYFGEFVQTESKKDEFTFKFYL